MPRDTTASMTASQGLDDDALLARYAAGDRAAAQILLDRLAPRVLRLARRLLQDPAEAEDVTQETLLRAFTRLDTFRGEAKFSSWLYQVGTNCIRMHLRSRRRRNAWSLEDHLREAEAADED